MRLAAVVVRNLTEGNVDRRNVDQASIVDNIVRLTRLRVIVRKKKSDKKPGLRW